MAVDQEIITAAILCLWQSAVIVRKLRKARITMSCMRNTCTYCAAQLKLPSNSDISKAQKSTVKHLDILNTACTVYQKLHYHCSFVYIL